MVQHKLILVMTVIITMSIMMATIIITANALHHRLDDSLLVVSNHSKRHLQIIQVVETCLESPP